MSDPSIEVVCRYRIKDGKADEFAAMLARHWPVLRDLGLTTEEPARLLKGEDGAGNVAFIETFHWKDQDAVSTAHETPGVMKLWEPMGALCEDMEFWHVEVVDAGA